MQRPIAVTLAMCCSCITLAQAQSTFDTQMALQARYDELSQATLQNANADDVDLIHTVLYTPDWVFVDAMGQQQAWSEVRAQQIQALSEPAPDAMTQRIQKVSATSEGAQAIVELTTVRIVTDREGRYGKTGVSHILVETSLFRDRWVHVGDDWKFKAREQVGQSRQRVDPSEWTEIHPSH